MDLIIPYINILIIVFSLDVHHMLLAITFEHF